MQSICVYCGSAEAIRPNFNLVGRQMGQILAENGIRLIFGGGKTGVMGAIANGALEAGGEVVGVIVESMNTPALAHAGLTRLEVTSTIHERKARMYELADGYIALPGGFGTFDELFETITWGQIGLHQKPIGLLNTLGYYDFLIQMINQAVSEGFIFSEHRNMLSIAADPLALLNQMRHHTHPIEAVKRWMRQE
jgi:uncharacterized protein (TIGR00730 family)